MSGLCFEVAGLYDALCEQNHWTLKLEADKECMVRADPAMMERVLHNLLGNATHHIGEDGVFVLRALPMPGGGCRVEVEDHGPGIPQEDLPTSLTVTTAPAKTPARWVPVWVFPSPKPFCSSTALPLACRASWAGVPCSGSR